MKKNYYDWILNHAQAKEDTWLASLKCGIHSGFPFCCIIFYIVIYRPLYKSKFSVKQNELWRLYSNKIPEISFGRIPCPYCIMFDKNPKEANDCNCYFASQERLDDFRKNILEGTIRFQ